jgi:hypothetical protein
MTALTEPWMICHVDEGVGTGLQCVQMKHCRILSNCFVFENESQKTSSLICRT